MAGQQQPAGRAVRHGEADDGWRRYSVEPSGSGFALAAAVIGVLGVLAGVNLWTVQLLFFGWIDLIAPVLLGAAALSLAGLAPAHPGRRLRIVGFVGGGIAIAFGLALFLGF